MTREVRIRVQGNIFKAYVDGKMVLEATHSAYTHGGVGLRTWDGSRACFQDPRIVFLSDPRRGPSQPTPTPTRDDRIRK